MSKFALLFLMVFFGGIIAALVYSGIAAFVLYQLVYFLNPDNRWWSASIPGLRYSMITVLLMMLVLAMKYRELSEKSPWSQQPVTKWILLILGMYYVMYLYALNLPAHKQFTFEFAKTIIIIAVAYKLINTERALNVVLWAYILGCTYIGYLATTTGRTHQGRVEGIGMIDGTDANDTSVALVPATALLMYYAWMGNKKVKLLCVVCGALIANGLVLLNSRGAFLGIAFAITFYLLFMLFSRYQKKGQRPMAIFILVAGLSGGLYLTDDMFWERMSTLQQLDDQQASGSGRTHFWFATFDMLKDYPAGLGIWGYQQISYGYLDPTLRGNVENRAVHSTWFQLLSELGWPGWILFGCLLVSLYRLSSKTKRYLISQGRTDEYFKILALEAGLLSFLVAASFIDRFRAEVLWWMILFIAAAGNVYYLQYQEQKQTRKRATRLNSPAREAASS